MLWYEKYNYQSQNWYSSTFLVHHFKDISKVVNGEWNNIEESGCHFVCLSMMIGVNPAYLASKLRENKKHYFLSDNSLHAKRLNSDKETKLVWDKNRPSEVGEVIEIKNINIPFHGFCNIDLKLKSLEQSHDLNRAIDLILKAKKKGLHIICGPEDHSFIIVGNSNKNDLLVWDPDTSSMDIREIQRMIEGGLKLTKVANDYEISESNPLQILGYELGMTPIKV